MLLRKTSNQLELTFPSVYRVEQQAVDNRRKLCDGMKLPA